MQAAATLVPLHNWGCRLPTTTCRVSLAGVVNKTTSIVLQPRVGRAKGVVVGTSRMTPASTLQNQLQQRHKQEVSWLSTISAAYPSQQPSTGCTYELRASA